MTGQTAPLTERRFLVPLMLITSLFFLWALGVNLNDILIPHLKKALDLTDFQSSLIQTAFFGGYFLAALPAGWLMRRVGYKRGILTGLMICATGTLLFLPAAATREYGFFLLALFVMACGQCFLEVAANPYVTMLGPPETAAWRLNTAQAFNSVGALVTQLEGFRQPAEGAEQCSPAIGSGRLLPALETALAGREPGVESVIDVTFPEAWRQPQLAGKTAQVHVTLAQVSEPVLPQVDAAFIRSFGVKSGDADKFREDIRANLERELKGCLLYTSDAADERSSGDLGGRRLLKKKKKTDKHDGTCR